MSRQFFNTGRALDPPAIVAMFWNEHAKVYKCLTVHRHRVI